MRASKFLTWLFNGAMHGFLVFYFFFFFWSTPFLPSGMDAGLFAFGLIIFHGVVITADLKLFLVAKLWTYYLVASSCLSVATLFVFNYVYTSFKW